MLGQSQMIIIAAFLAQGVSGVGWLPNMLEGGMQLHLAQKTLNYKNMLALVIFIIVLIASMERVSDYLRRKMLGSNTLK